MQLVEHDDLKATNLRFKLEAVTKNANNVIAEAVKLIESIQVRWSLVWSSEVLGKDAAYQP